MKINKAFIYKILSYMFFRIRFLNIKNKNILNTVNRDYYYSKYKRKFKKYLIKEKFNYSNKIDYKNKVWVFWYQGLENAPILVKKTIESLFKYLPNKEIIILTKDNLNNYVSLPEYIQKKFEKGIIPMAHYSDLVRLELLTTYGGLWVDSTVLLTDTPNYINMDIPLFVYKNISLYRKEELPVAASNWLIYSNGKSDILNLTKKLMFIYWKKTNFLKVYSIFHIMFKFATEIYSDEWNLVPTYSNIPPHVLQFELLKKYSKERIEQIKKMSDVHKLNHRMNSDDSESIYAHIIKEEL